MRGGQLRYDSDRTASVIILICMTIAAVGCILGVSYLLEYNFYEKGDNGKTAKSIAVQNYSLDDAELAKDYYNCAREGENEYRLNYYKEKFAPENSSFVFTVNDIKGNVLFDSTQDSDYSYEEIESASEYRGNSDFYTFDENGNMLPLKINYAIRSDSQGRIGDKYTNAFRWIEIANSLRYVLIAVLILAILIIVVLLSMVTINAGLHDSEDSEVVEGFVDRIPLDICTLFIMAVFAVAWIVIGLTSAADVDMVVNNVVIMITCVAVVLVLMTYLTTLSVRVKKGKAYKNTLIYMVLRKFKRKTPRKVRKVFGDMPVFGKLIFGIVIYVVSEAAILCAIAYLGILSEKFEPMSVFKMFLIIWGMTRLLIIPIFAMIAINLHYVKEEGQRLAEGVLGDEIAHKLTISSIRAHAQNLDQIRKEINKAVEQELKSERLKNELITNVSHDIKTPLTSIGSYVDFLRNENLTEEERKKYIEIIARNTEKLTVLANNLVDISQINAGDVEINLEKTSLNIIIEQTVEEFALKFEQCGLLPRISMPENEIFVMGDGEYIWRILSNLLNNACKYAAEGSDIRLSLESDGGKAVIRISNDLAEPIEIPGDELFERFVRSDSSRHTEGNGLGLSIAKQLAQLQSGKLDVEITDTAFTAVLVFDEAV